ncbi:MAG: twin-arginine translocation signal domain-containing protein, partial [Selenomonadaceae bacterium]|nr:twin-arginine translocation signal domain-containing protein [Selenomonadaceae bacterium]
MVSKLNRREFIKTASLAALSMAVPLEVFAAEKTGADLVVFGKIFTSENNRIVEAFAVKDG